MQPEEQQRIMGYFIEEAKDHLNTIEQGLLNLQATISDSEQANEVFRAAHSVKGGAAMLGLESIQKTAHRMEDYFKILKESPVQVDRALETMFLRISDGLKDLLEQLEGPFGLTQDKAQSIMADVEPVFSQIEAHLNKLVGEPNAKPDIQVDSIVRSQEGAKARFQRDGASFLRKMLAAFKQPDDAKSRQTIQDICDQLYNMGQQFELAEWCDLIETARLVAASQDNEYRALAPVLIKDIKKAEDLVLSGRASEIEVSEAMQAMLPEDLIVEEVIEEGNSIEDFDLESSLEDSLHGLDFASEDDLSDVFENELPDDVQPPAIAEEIDSENEKLDEEASVENESFDSLFEGSELNDELTDEESSDSANSAFGKADTLEDDDIERLSLDLDFDEIPSELSALDRDTDTQEKNDESLDALLSTVNVTGPEVGVEELNSLADLFDGDLDELDNTLGGHAFATQEMQLHPEKIDLSPEDDLRDLLSSDANDELQMSSNDEDLFGGTLTDEEFAIASEVEIDPELIDAVAVENGIPIEDELLEDELSDAFLDLSNDPWDDDGVVEAIEEESEGENFSKVELESDELNDIEKLSLENSSGEQELDSLTNQSAEDLLYTDEDSLKRAASQRTINGPQFKPSHTVSPKEEDIDFPTLTGQQLQKAEEDIDNFFSDDDSELGELFSDSAQLTDDAWGEVSIEADDVNDEDITVEEDLLTEDTLGENISDIEKSSDSAQTASFEQSSEQFLLEDSLEESFLIEDDAEHRVGLDVAQHETELDELLEDVDNTFSSDAHSLDSDTEELWDELLSDSSEAEQLIESSADIDLESELLSDTSEIDLKPEDSLSIEEDFAADFEHDLLGAESAEYIGVEDSYENVDHIAIEEVQEGKEVELESIEEELSDPQSDSSLETQLDAIEQSIEADLEADFNELSHDSALNLLDSPLDTETSTESESHTSEDEQLLLESLDTSPLDLDSDLSRQLEEIESSEDDSVNEGSIDGLLSETLEIGIDLDESAASENRLSEIVDSDQSDEIDSSNFDSLSRDISGDELSDEILADFETAFGTGISNEFASEEMLDTDSEAQSPMEMEPEREGIEATESNALDISDLEIDGLLDEGLDAELDGFLTDEELAEIDGSLPEIDDHVDSDLKESFGEENRGTEDKKDDFDESNNLDDTFDDLDALLAEEGKEALDFDEVDVDGPPTLIGQQIDNQSEESSPEEDFGDLERLLEEKPTESSATPQRRTAPSAARRSTVREQTMRVSVSHLDTLSNLVGELVVSRNTLERDQERLRQFLDNLLFQVQQLNDVGQRMRDLYERSLLESSLMSNRRARSTAPATPLPPDDPTSFFESHATGETFDALEMDRFTGFHTLSQEMIELIVRVRESASDIGYTVESSDQVTRQFRQITTQLQEGLNTARMVAFSQAADRLPRAVRDISMKCGKEARLVVEGQDTLIDKMIVEHLYDPLTHLVNNAITHGIETPEARRAAGKPSEGMITVRAFYQGNQTVIYVADDGGGINTDFVKKKAVEKQLITPDEAASLSDIETYDLLFHPGFSTRDQADDFAGRGVGMDVVRTSLAEIRGSITIDSELGKGTSFTIRLPLTLSISKALTCVSAQARIAFPMDGVEDMLDVPRDRIEKNDSGQDCVRWRDKVLPFQPVTELLKFNRKLGRSRVYGGSQEDDVLSIIVLRSANTHIAVQVDQVIGEQEIVIKQLEGPVTKPLGIAGATVLGDGRVMPIADVIELIDIAMGRVRREPSSLLWAQEEAGAVEEPEAKSDPTVLIVDDSITVRELLSMSFNKVGYRVEQARDGQEAWDKLRSGLPCDLVFCDIEMPRMDGLELLSRMQKDNHLKRIPIAMLTSRGADRHRQMAVDLGASGYFTKPYLEEALLDAAQRMLNGETLAKGRGG